MAGRARAAGLAPPATRRSAPSRRPPHAPLLAALADGVAITVAATLATAPLLAHQFGYIPLAGLPANLAALPAVAPAMWLGMVKTALGQLSAPFVPGPIAGVASAAAGVTGKVARFPSATSPRVAERFADMPGGRLVAPAPVRRRRRGRVRPARPGRPRPPSGHHASRRPASGSGPSPGVRLPRSRRRPLAAALMAAALLRRRGAARPAGPARSAHGPVPRRRAGRRRPDPAPRRHRGPLRRRPSRGRGGTRLLRRAGVDRLALVVATHPSRDHHGGLAEVLRRFPVDTAPRRGRRHARPVLPRPRAAGRRARASSESRRSPRWPSRSPAAACASVCCRRLRGRRARRPRTPTRAPSSRSSARAAST